MPLGEHLIREFAPVTSLEESTEAGQRLTRAKNAILRPKGGFKGTLKYQRLLGIPTFYQKKTAIYGATSVSVLKTTAVQITSQGKHWLLFYDWTQSMCRGLFYLGDDGTYNGALDLVGGSPTYTSLETGFDEDARWYGQRVYEQIFLGNGVNLNRVAQLARAGVLRIAATNSKPAKPVIDAVAVSTVANVQATWTIPGGGGGGQRAGAASLTFTANQYGYPGTSGHNIKVRITYSPYAGAITVSRTGAGTSGSPYHFTITTGPGAGNSSNNAIVSAVNASTEAFGVMAASTSASDATADTGSWSLTALSGGVDANESVGFSDTTKTVFLRYWDPGTNGFGYEGPSSDQSDEVVIPSGGGNERDIRVSVTGNSAIDGGRFGYIRIYLQFGTGDDAIWNLVRTVPNSDGTTLYTLGTDLELGQVMSDDQPRPFKTRYFSFCAQKLWLAGNPDSPTNLWRSKPAVSDELAPEGANPDEFLVIPGNVDETGAAQINALAGDEGHVHAHTSRGITLIAAADDSRYVAQVSSGAFSQVALAGWEKAKTFYMGRDLLVYEFAGAQYNNTAQDAPNARFRSLDAAAYMADLIDRDALATNPDRMCSMSDTRGQMLWFWLPASDGTLKGFAFDHLLGGIVGEFDFPKLYAVAQLEANRSEIVACDEAGNLFVIDTADQSDHGDTFSSQSAFTPHTLGYTPPVSQQGWGTVNYDGSKYTQAYETIIETGMIDLGKPGLRKQWVGIVFTTIPNSRAIVEATLLDEGGRSVTRAYGDVGQFSEGACKHKLVLQMSAFAVKLRLRVIGAEQKAWMIRDVKLLYLTGFEK